MNKTAGYIIIAVLTLVLGWGVYTNFIKVSPPESDTVGVKAELGGEPTAGEKAGEVKSAEPEVKKEGAADQKEGTEKTGSMDKTEGAEGETSQEAENPEASHKEMGHPGGPNRPGMSRDHGRGDRSGAGSEADSVRPPQEKMTDEGHGETAAEGAADQGDPADHAEEPGDGAEAAAAETTDGATEAADGAEVNPDPMIKINLNGVEVKNLIGQLADWTGKVVIPVPEVMGQKLIIYSQKEMRRSKALDLIYTGLREKGFRVEETEDILYIKPLKGAILGNVPMVAENQELATIENKNQIVQKFFRMENYSPSQMQKILLPLIPDYGYISADESTGNLVIIDTVSNLLRIQGIIKQMDIPEYEPTVTQVFEVHRSDPAEIVQLLKIMLGDQRRSYSSNRGPANKGAAQSVQISKDQIPVVLIPEPKRKWIIARGSQDDIAKIEEWVTKLDQEQADHREYSLKKIDYADVNEVARQLTNMIRQMPGQEIRSTVLVQPMVQTNQIMIVGSAENRAMIEKLIEEVDIPADKLLTAHFKLKYADPEQLKEYIEELFSQQNASGRRGYDYYYYRRDNSNDKNMVKVIAYPALKQITVIASAENMEKVKQQIDEWDKPIDPNEVQPLIVNLQNSDPVKLSTLLAELFSEDAGMNNDRFMGFMFGFGRGSQTNRKKIVGPLYGQLTFKPVPDTKKIIVISKIPEAYEVVEELIKKLDRQEPAELPMIVEIKYADCEDLSEQLNAIFSETGPVEIRRSKRGLSNYEAANVDSADGGGNNNSGNRGGNNNSASPGMMRFSWGRPTQNQMPTSNLLGKIRFMPVYRSKSLMVLSPQEYQESIKEMISELDRPARQVMIKAIIVMVNHDNLMSLGSKLATDPAALGSTSENALIALSKLANAEQPGQSLVIDNSLEVNVLLDLLVKEAEAQVLNQPTLWTKDNEQAEFFKGRNVAFKSLSITSAEGGSTKDSVKYNPVGLTLRVRPNITPANDVDMEIFLDISQVEPELVSGNIATSDFKTTTYMIVKNGQALMLSGYMFKNESKTVTKVPLLGDIPLLGELFKHHSVKSSNTELLAFITPYIVDDSEDVSRNSLIEIEKSKNKMEKIKEKLTNEVQ